MPANNSDDGFFHKDATPDMVSWSSLKDKEITETIQRTEEFITRVQNITEDAREEIMLMLPSSNAFSRWLKFGTYDIFDRLIKRHCVNIKILISIPISEEARTNLNDEKLNQEDIKVNNIAKYIKNSIPSINFGFIDKRKEQTGMPVLIIDNKEVLIWEVKDDSKEDIRESTGIAIYSNSKPIVLSYHSIFETLWRQTELYEQLKQSDRLKTEFINIAAHELRTPIMPILGYAEMLEEEEEEQQQGLIKDNNRKSEGIAAIIRNAKRLQRLADDILDVTRIESNTLKIDKEQINLNDLILNTLDDIIINTKEEELRDNYNNRRKLLYKASEETIIIYADRTRLTQVISNLLSNAIKFTKKEEGEISISVTIEKDDDNSNNNSNTNEVIVSVKDNGSGIDSQIFPRLFTKFASKSHQGTGLGLFISKSIIEAHGGKMWAENNSDGRGATFSFTLPL